MATKHVRSISNSKDLRKLYSIIGSLIGQRCWKAELGYGDELFLHFGKQVRSIHPKLPGEKEGEWILGTCGTGWELFSPSGVVASGRGSTLQLEKEAKILQHSNVTKVGVSVPSNDLTLAFDNRSLFRVVPKADDDQHDDVPYWELFLPNHMLVEFHSGSRWSYRRSDVPAT